MTTAKKTYSEKLKHPLWQRKRLEILERDSFCCQKCGDIDSMLVVHHKYYIKGKEHWEYEDTAFITLCEDCHNWIHKVYDKAKTTLDKRIILIKHKISILGFSIELWNDMEVALSTAEDVVELFNKSEDDICLEFEFLKYT